MTWLTSHKAVSPTAHEMQQNKDPTYFTAGKWTVRDLLHYIHKKTGRNVPYPTIKRWRKHLGIYPDDEQLYTDCDRDGLLGMARWLDRGGKVKPYADRFIQFVQQSGNHHG